MTIGDRIKEHRKKRKITQKKLAELTGLAEITIRNYEANRYRPKYEQVQKISSALNVSEDVLFYGYEVDREYELICDTLESAGFKIEPAGYCASENADWDIYYIFHEDSTHESETPVEIPYYKLADVVKSILADAEKNKKFYITKRLEAELFLNPNI